MSARNTWGTRIGTTVARDPFAREELRRVCVGAGSCEWCGQKRRRVYTYSTETDSGRNLGGNGKTFCGLPCFRSFNN